RNSVGGQKLPFCLKSVVFEQFPAVQSWHVVRIFVPTSEVSPLSRRKPLLAVGLSGGRGRLPLFGKCGPLSAPSRTDSGNHCVCSGLDRGHLCPNRFGRHLAGSRPSRRSGPDCPCRRGATDLGVFVSGRFSVARIV